VLNNKEAQINVGDQIPVTTTFFQPGAGSGIGGAPTTTGSVQFRDTGVILNVVPRVNPGGLVFMEISQEVSSPGDVDPFSGNREIQRRTINTEIAIQSGDTIIMGGLIQEQTTVSKTGVPGLSAIPIIGNLFGSRKNEVQRNELILMLTPTVISSSEEARRVSEEYTKKFRGLKPLQVRRPQFGDTRADTPEGS
jgi:general secretion pathway protein D